MGRSLASRVNFGLLVASTMALRLFDWCLFMCILPTPCSHRHSFFFIFLVSSRAEVPCSLFLWALTFPSVTSGGACLPLCLAWLPPLPTLVLRRDSPMRVSGFWCECWGRARTGQPGCAWAGVPPHAVLASPGLPGAGNSSCGPRTGAADAEAPGGDAAGHERV